MKNDKIKFWKRLSRYEVLAEHISLEAEKRTCPNCNSKDLELVVIDQLACKSCRSLWFMTNITDEEMKKWFGK